ncbi:hypothetical protein ABK040_016153 [Willaertia magna]
MKIKFFLLLLTLTLFAGYLVKAQKSKGLRKLKATAPAVNIWNQKGHDSDNSYRSNYQKTHSPWSVTLPRNFYPIITDISLNNDLLYVMLSKSFPDQVLGFVNVTNGRFISTLNIYRDQFAYNDVAPVINSNGDFFIVRVVKGQLRLVKVDKSRTNANPITDLSELQNVYSLAIDDNHNIVVVAGHRGFYGVNGNDGSIVWKNPKVSVITNFLTLVNELDNNNSMIPVAYITSADGCILKINVLTGELIFKQCVGPQNNIHRARAMVGPDNIYTLASVGVEEWGVFIFNKNNGKQVYTIKLVDQSSSLDTFEYCSHMTKVNNNLVLYCKNTPVKQRTTSYLFSLDTNGMNIKYSVKYDGELDGDIVVLKNSDLVIKDRTYEAYIQFSGDNGKKKKVVANMVASVCKATAANNNMLYFCCQEQGNGICQAVATLP